MSEMLTPASFNLPGDVKYIIEEIEKIGHDAYAVGGCVRDTLLGKIPNDWDITTSALPETVKSVFRRTIDTGIAHGTVTVMLGKNGYEVTTYRIDGEYADGRHPNSVEFTANLTDDLCRRDFTINAMAYNDSIGFVDEFGGIDDLNNQIIRCVGNPEQRFTEDALRMMRAIRFSAQLGFEIHPDTYAAIIKLAPNISKISMERVHVELNKTLLSDHPDYIIEYVKTGIFSHILPVIDDALNSKYKTRIISALKYSDCDLYMRYAALFSGSSSDDTFNTLRLLKMDNKTIDIVSKLVACVKDDIEETEPAVRTALNKYGRDFLPLLFDYMEVLVKAGEDVTGIHNPAKIKHLITLRRLATDIIERGDCFSIKDLDITGRDLIEYGLSGKDIGDTLNSLLQAVIENPKLNEKANLIALIEHLK